jgi:hypothetical protein
LVSGVPLTPSRGGAGGLPDLPREGRGLGVLSLGARGMGRYMARAGSAGNRQPGLGAGLLTGAGATAAGAAQPRLMPIMKLS